MPTGSCVCQKLKYEFDEKPEGMALCHCLTCQKISGGLFTVNYMIPETSVRFTAGTAKHFTATHECGLKLTVYFCGDCGSHIYKTGDREGFQGVAVIQVGTLDEPESLRKVKPSVELWTKYRVPWLPHFEGAALKSEF